mmetsp:Transcript_39902/g.104575  ORF Transcript_39902/g.104575 Transcript_39902/m.104575 type:complete len:100 (-) Transcript_39902:3-302(-)
MKTTTKTMNITMRQKISCSSPDLFFVVGWKRAVYWSPVPSDVQHPQCLGLTLHNRLSSIGYRALLSCVWCTDAEQALLVVAGTLVAGCLQDHRFSRLRL